MLLSILACSLLLCPTLPALAAPTTPRVASADPARLESVDECLARGRGLLNAGQLDEALAAFEAAQRMDNDSLRTRVFVLRTWIAQGRIEDALGEADGLAGKHKGSIELDYLYGMGFLALAARDAASGQTTAMTGSQFEDSLAALSKVTAKNEARFEDAWYAQAQAAWYAQQIPAGLAAIDRAIELAPKDPWRRLMRGRLALSGYLAVREDATQASAAEAQWQAAADAFKKAIEIGASSPTPSERACAQAACGQLAATHLWKQQVPDAVNAYARAVTIDPATADYAAMSGALSADDFVRALEQGHKDWLAANPTPGAKDSTLLWWLGYANYLAKRFPQAGEAFEATLAKNPGFLNSWYYLFRVRYDQQVFDKSLAALHEYARVDAPGLEAALAYDVVGNTARLEFLIGWCMTPENHGGKIENLEAAFVCELITKIVPRVAEQSRHWNNLGLFLRDEGDAIRGTQGALRPAPKPYDEAKVLKLWEDALAAYEVSLELEPANPNYLNDTAVMLHYYLIRDLERAKGMYQRGFEEATALLKRTDLTKTRREEVQIALRDTGNNVKLVQRLIDQRAAEAAAPKGDKPAGQQ